MSAIFLQFILDSLGKGSKRITELSLKKVLISQLLCRQPEHDAAVWTHNILAVLIDTADVFQIAAASDGLHNGK